MWVQFDNVYTTQISNDICPHTGFDLLIGDLSEGIFVPLVSPSAILEWNKHDSDEIEGIFEFAFHFLQDDAHILLFVPESKNVRLDVWTFAATYEFVLIKDWWGINFMHLCSRVDASSKVYVVDNFLIFLIWKHQCWCNKHLYINIHNVVGFVITEILPLFVPPSQKI